VSWPSAGDRLGACPPVTTPDFAVPAPVVAAALLPGFGAAAPPAAVVAAAVAAVADVAAAALCGGHRLVVSLSRGPLLAAQWERRTSVRRDT